MDCIVLLCIELDSAVIKICRILITIWRHVIMCFVQVD